MYDGFVFVGQNVPRGERAGPIILLILLTALDSLLMAGLFMVQPNQGAVLLLFGKYSDTVRKAGLPIEIAAVVVWQVVDTAEASFQVDSYENYVHVQSEAALRNLATNYPYECAGRPAWNRG